MNTNRKERLVEVVGIGLTILLSYFLVVMDGLPVFIGPFNNQDNSITPARLLDVMVSLGIIFSLLYGVYPRYWSREKQKQFVLYSAIVVLGFSVIEFFGDQLILYYYELPADPEMAFSIHNVEDPKYFHFTRLPGNLYVYLVALGYCLLKTWIRWEQLLERRQKDQLQTELDFLRAQISPHFLFNSLNNIYAITHRNNDAESGEAITKLSGLLRYLVYEGGKEKVSLKGEIQLIKDYIAVHRLRFSDEDPVSIEIYVHGEPERWEIAPLLFVPLVENAFKHGINATPEGKIEINLDIEKESLTFRIVNSRPEEPVAAGESSGVGLSNLRKRLELLYPKDHSLILEEDDRTYTVVLRLPYA